KFAMKNSRPPSGPFAFGALITNQNPEDRLNPSGAFAICGPTPAQPVCSWLGRTLRGVADNPGHESRLAPARS
ncbi:hypothetical protein, partial [Mesorhizobium amorphae]|uniref:hypothetical protein n=1 Tax=Mesorhizobium amorphae TaxID=71433 RepID=UPI001AEC1F74